MHHLFSWKWGGTSSASMLGTLMIDCDWLHHSDRNKKSIFQFHKIHNLTIFPRNSIINTQIRYHWQDDTVERGGKRQTQYGPGATGQRERQCYKRTVDSVATGAGGVQVRVSLTSRYWDGGDYGTDKQASDATDALVTHTKMIGRTRQHDHDSKRQNKGTLSRDWSLDTE